MFQPFGITRYRLAVARLPAAAAGAVVLHISDLHNNNYGETLLQVARQLQPLLIVVPGDLVNGRQDAFQPAARQIVALTEVCPVYFTPGNHEERNIYRQELNTYFTERGVCVLRDAAAQGPAGLRIVGLMDPTGVRPPQAYAKRPRGAQDAASFDLPPQPRLTFKSIPLLTPADHQTMRRQLAALCQPDACNLVLCHRPLWEEVLAQSPAQLVFCGHAHGGQVRIGLGDGLFSPDEGFFPQYTAGIRSAGDTAMVISRGVGRVRFPRVFNPPELVAITLEPKKDGPGV